MGVKSVQDTVEVNKYKHNNNYKIKAWKLPPLKAVSQVSASPKDDGNRCVQNAAPGLGEESLSEGFKFMYPTHIHQIPRICH